MKTAFRITLLLISLSFAGLAQYSPEQMENTEVICKEVKANLNSYKKVEKFKDNTGTRCAFLQDKTLKMVRAESTETGITKTVEWYFVNDVLIYCEQVWIVAESKKVINHEKLYQNKGQLIAWIKTDGKATDPLSPIFKETDFYLNEYAKKLVKEAKE